jgi:hypothetical protein
VRGQAVLLANLDLSHARSGYAACPLNRWWPLGRRAASPVRVIPPGIEHARSRTCRRPGLPGSLPMRKVSFDGSHGRGRSTAGDEERLATEAWAARRPLPSVPGCEMHALLPDLHGGRRAAPRPRGLPGVRGEAPPSRGAVSARAGRSAAPVVRLLSSRLIVRRGAGRGGRRRGRPTARSASAGGGTRTLTPPRGHLVLRRDNGSRPKGRFSAWISRKPAARLLSRPPRN